MPNRLHPKFLRRGLLDSTGANLKSSLTTSSYTGGAPTSFSDLRHGLVQGGTYRRSLLQPNGEVKPSVFRPRKRITHGGPGVVTANSGLNVGVGSWVMYFWVIRDSAIPSTSATVLGMGVGGAGVGRQVLAARLSDNRWFTAMQGGTLQPFLGIAATVTNRLYRCVLSYDGAGNLTLTVNGETETILCTPNASNGDFYQGSDRFNTLRWPGSSACEIPGYLDSPLG